jgi:ribosomal protein L17
MAKSAKDITVESVVDSLNTYLSSLSLKDIKTTEPKKLDEVIGKLITISKNSKVSEKVNA